MVTTVTAKLSKLTIGKYNDAKSNPKEFLIETFVVKYFNKKLSNANIIKHNFKKINLIITSKDKNTNRLMTKNFFLLEKQAFQDKLSNTLF